MADKKIVGWFTMSGKHIPVFEGESKQDAVKRSVKGFKAPGKDKQPVPKGQTDKKWKEFEDASRKADVMRKDIDYPEYYKKEREAGRAFDKSVKQEQAHGTISIKKKKPSVAEQNEKIKQKQIAENKAQADKLNGKTTKKDEAVKKVVERMSEKVGKKPAQKELSDDDKKFVKDMIKEATARVPAGDKFTSNDLIKDNDIEDTVDKYAKEFGGDKERLLGIIKANLDKQISDYRDKKGVTRKDVEELTAKKDALKGTKLNTKPITQKEIDEQKKTWGDRSKSKYKTYSDVQSAVFSKMSGPSLEFWEKNIHNNANYESDVRRAFSSILEGKSAQNTPAYKLANEIITDLRKSGVPNSEIRDAYKFFLNRFFDPDNYEEDDED